MPGKASTERGQGRRTTILRAALGVIAEHGVSHTTHRKVADAAGVPNATTTYYFATLDELLEEALRLYVREEVAALRGATEALGGAASPEEVAGRIAAVLAEDRQANSSGQFALYLAAARRPGLREAAAECLVAYEEFARAALVLLGSPHADELAPVFVAYADGLGLHRLARGEATEPEDLAQRLMTLFAHTHDAAAVAT
jgi:TetR/AcrR family transcriptional regulator, regulator of biofilm formation and stress response